MSIWPLLVFAACVVVLFERAGHEHFIPLRFKPWVNVERDIKSEYDDVPYIRG